jgi:MerR family transcriptional regulator, light-induced transcriptional regulator
MLETIVKNHPKIWSDFSLERRVQVRETFLAAFQSLEESLATGSPAFLNDQTRWEQARFASLHFPAEFTVVFFTAFKNALAKELPADYRKRAGAFAGKAIAALKSQPAGKDALPDAGPSVSPAARSFLNTFLAGDRAGGRAVIDKALAAGIPVREIYTGIFQPVLWETGVLWQQNKATVAKEHFVTGVVRRIMDQPHDKVAATGRTSRRDKREVAACVGEELHEIGIRMVADFFEMDGWDVNYTGANTPVKSIIAAVKDQKADVLALSITMPSRLADVGYLIRSLRADEDTAQVKIIVGGYPFAILPDLWKQVGADAVAAGAEDAVAVATRLTASNWGTA